MICRLKRLHRYRTLFLAILATASFAFAAVFSFGVPAEEIWRVFFYSLLMLLMVMLVAALVLAAGVLIKRLLAGLKRR